jgi:hypothetical protein
VFEVAGFAPFDSADPAFADTLMSGLINGSGLVN